MQSETARVVALSNGALALAEKLRSLQITDAEGARRLSVSRAVICRWLSGRRRPSLALALRVERVFGIPAIDWTKVSKSRNRRR